MPVPRRLVERFATGHTPAGYLFSENRLDELVSACMIEYSAAIEDAGNYLKNQLGREPTMTEFFSFLQEQHLV